MFDLLVEEYTDVTKCIFYIGGRKTEVLRNLV